MKLNKMFLFLCILLIVLSGSTLFAAGAKEAAPKELTVLTWNIPFLEDTIKGWIADFEADHPGFKVKWIDKHGTELDAFLMTQIVAGEMPDIIDFQGALFSKYAAMGALQPLTPFLAKDAEAQQRYDKGLLESALAYDNETYQVPFYYTPSLLYYNKLMFKEAGITSPPKTLDELFSYAERMTKGEKSGFMTLNFDWLYWPLFAESGVEFLDPTGTKAAFNTPKAEALIKRLADLTAKGAISTISWTKRWAELNDAFAAGIIGMYNSNSSTYHNVKASGDWINEDTMGLAQFPGAWKVAGAHGFAMSSFTKYPQEAWELMKVMTNDKWAQEFIKQTNILTGNVNVDSWYMNQPEIKNDSLNYTLVDLAMKDSDKVTGHFPIAEEALVKDTFFNIIQGALLGETSAKDALNRAEVEVNKILNK